MTGHDSDPDGWRDHAECRRRQLSPELFFPTRGEHYDPAALEACQACPVSTECLTDALATNELGGMRGGLTGRQLRQRRRQWLTNNRRATAEQAVHTILTNNPHRRFTAAQLADRTPFTLSTVTQAARILVRDGTVTSRIECADMAGIATYGLAPAKTPAPAMVEVGR